MSAAPDPAPHPAAAAELVPRPAVAADFDPLLDLWVARWHDAHAACSPPELLALRTREDFRTRLAGFGDGLWVIGPQGAPQGFYSLKGNHVDQLYVARELTGQGVALMLLRDAEARLAAAGHVEALLDCNTGNARAARFYQKSGWTLRGRELVELDSSSGPFPLEVFVFTRRLTPPLSRCISPSPEA
jgi:GNAT superfamily N-acetyltransferase